jgi:hypothetical protein
MPPLACLHYRCRAQKSRAAKQREPCLAPAPAATSAVRPTIRALPDDGVRGDDRIGKVIEGQDKSGRQMAAFSKPQYELKPIPVKVARSLHA